MRKIFKKSGFTMAEAILVMTILGIIATIMITTMKPAQFKEKGYQILAKQTLADLDTALDMVLTNHCPYGTLDACYKLGTTELFSMADDGVGSAIYLGALLKKYMATSRTKPKDALTDDYTDDMFVLKNGVHLNIDRDFYMELNTYIPGEKGPTVINFVNPHYGIIEIDINGNDEPNAMGKDFYRIPLDKYGIMGGD